MERKDDSQLNRNDTRFVLEEKQAKSNPASVKAKAKGTYVSHWEQELTDSVWVKDANIAAWGNIWAQSESLPGLARSWGKGRKDYGSDI